MTDFASSAETSPITTIVVKSGRTGGGMVTAYVLDGDLREGRGRHLAQNGIPGRQQRHVERPCGAILRARQIAGHELGGLAFDDRKCLGRQRRMKFIVSQQLHAAEKFSFGTATEKRYPALSFAAMSSNAF